MMFSGGITDMAKPVTFSKPKKTKKPKADTSFNFGFNTLSKPAKKAYRKATGGGS